MKNIMNTLFCVVILIAFPACCGKRKCCPSQQKEDIVTINNAVDAISIERVEAQSTAPESAEQAEELLSKF